MSRRARLGALGALLALVAPPPGEASAQQPAAPEDVATLDGIIHAYYEVVSGPAGEPADRARDATLHHPDALVGIVGADPAGEPVLRTMTLDQYHDRFGGPREAPFYEWEIHRDTRRFGAIAHVWSTYATSDAPDGLPRARGINSIQLYWDGARWWITSWIFDQERAGRPIPPAYLPDGG